MASIINAATSGGLVTSADTSGILQLQTASTTAVTVTASQNVGIGTTSPSTPLDVTKAGGANFVATFQNTTAGTPYCVFIKDAASSASGYPLLAVTDSTGNSTYLRVDSSTGNVGIGTTPNAGASDGVLKISRGITFPATQSASSDANTLDDYEEGTWTPNQGTGLTVVGAFNSSGIYTKIGNLVTVNFRVGGATSVACSSGGDITTNLPFSVAGTPGNAMGSIQNSNNSLSGAYGFTTTISNSTTALAVAGAIFVTITYQV
jgi:hypothetical protein